MDKQKILNKYSKPADKLLISKMLDKIELSSKSKREYTDFLDGYQENLLEKILKREKIENYVISGGTESAERKIILFYSSKLQPIIETDLTTILPIKCIRIQLPKEQYGQYTHRDYLGGLIKLGIKREKIGDIFVLEEGADLLVLEEISKFLLENITNLTRFQKAQVKLIPLNDIRQKQPCKEEIKVNVASMRLDGILSEILRTSRGKAEEMIRDARVFVNFEEMDKLTKQIKEKDCISVRGKGRFEIEKIEGMTKNHRIKLVVSKFV